MAVPADGGRLAHRVTNAVKIRYLSESGLVFHHQQETPATETYSRIPCGLHSEAVASPPRAKGVSSCSSHLCGHPGKGTSAFSSCLKEVVLFLVIQAVTLQPKCSGICMLNSHV